MSPLRSCLLSLTIFFLGAFTYLDHAQAFSDITTKTYEYIAISAVVKSNWIPPVSTSTFGYGTTISPTEWLRALMFLRSDDACPELGKVVNEYWTPENISACLSGAGVPVATETPDRVRRDEAMQQLFALRRRSFAFQQLETKPAGYVDPLDLSEIQTNRQGAIIAGDRLKLIFRSKNKILPAGTLLREDAALSIWRLLQWEKEGGADAETNDQLTLSKEAKLHHWRDLDTDLYVIEVKTGGDTFLRPILPRRSFNPAKDPTTEKVRDEFVYQPVSALAKESGAIAAVNGSYFNVDWPWGALEDVAIVDGKTILERTDRSTFIVCADGTMLISKLDKTYLKSIKCEAKQGLGAGPLFLSKGEILTKSTKEGFDEFTQWERRVGSNARTAIGISADRKTAYVIVVAGKSYPAFGRGGSSLGTFLKEKYPDIADAMMFDGGGSSALYANGALLVGTGESGNKTERSVISALGIFSKKAEQASTALFKKEQLKRWDKTNTIIKIEKPTKDFPWQTAKEAKKDGMTITLSGTRGSHAQIIDTKKNTLTFQLIFDLIAYDSVSKLTITRREGTHEKGWKIPTEIHVLDPKDGSDTDIIKLFAYLPETQKPDLKTFEAIAFRPSGIVFGDGTGRYWFYYEKENQLSPATFMKKR